MGSNEQDSRQPNDLTGLLKFCIQNTTGDDVPGHQDGLENDEERKKFLMAALSSLTQSPIEQLKKGIEFVNNRLNEIEGSDSSPEMITEATDSIQDCVENIILDIVSSIDFANDFYKLNGLDLIKRLLSTRIPRCVTAGCDIIAETVQNNPSAQNTVTDSGLLVDLLNLVDGNVASVLALSEGNQLEDVRVKALYAVSCLIRENESSLKVFESNHGYTILIRSIVSKNQKLRIKSSFLLVSLIQANPTVPWMLHSLGFLGQVVPILSEPHDESHEHLLSAVNFLVTQHEESRSEVSKSGLKSVLEKKLIELDGKEEHLEELKYCQEILKLCFK